MKKRTSSLLTLTILSAVLLVACGGGDGDKGPDGAAAGGAGGGGGAAAGAGGRGGAGGVGTDARTDAPAAPDASADRAGGGPGADTGTTDGRRDGWDAVLADGAATDGMVSGDARADGNTMTPAQWLDQCFAGLPAPVAVQNVDSKASADGRTHVRIALDTGDRIGTSGTYPWEIVRFGLVRDGAGVCVTTPAGLMYKTTHHNCGDTATVTAGGVRYELTAPDRATTRVSAFMSMGAGSTMLYGPVELTRTGCASNRPGGACMSGGPCN
jgi:hypothetical protein